MGGVEGNCLESKRVRAEANHSAASQHLRCRWRQTYLPEYIRSELFCSSLCTSLSRSQPCSLSRSQPCSLSRSQPSRSTAVVSHLYATPPHIHMQSNWKLSNRALPLQQTLPALSLSRESARVHLHTRERGSQQAQERGSR